MANTITKVRINGARYNAKGLDISTPGANQFDIIYMAWFRSVEEAEAYVQNTMIELGWVEETEPDTTEPIEVTTESVKETTEPVKETIEPTETDVETKTEQTTAPKGDETVKADQGGCGSIVGFDIIAIVATAAIVGSFSFKKKK